MSKSISVEPTTEMDNLLKSIVDIFQKEVNQEIEGIKSISFKMKEKIEEGDNNNAYKNISHPEHSVDKFKAYGMVSRYIRGRYVCRKY